MCPKSSLVYKRKVLSGRQHSLLQGYSEKLQSAMDITDDFEPFQKDLAENAFSFAAMTVSQPFIRSRIKLAASR